MSALLSELIQTTVHHLLHYHLFQGTLTHNLDYCNCLLRALLTARDALFDITWFKSFLCPHLPMSPDFRTMAYQVLLSSPFMSSTTLCSLPVTRHFGILALSPTRHSLASRNAPRPLHLLLPQPGLLFTNIEVKGSLFFHWLQIIDQISPYY